MFLVGYGHIYMFLVGYAKLLNELLPLAVAPGHIYSSVWYEDRCKLSQTLEVLQLLVLNLLTDQSYVARGHIVVYIIVGCRM